MRRLGAVTACTAVAMVGGVLLGGCAAKDDNSPSVQTKEPAKEHTEGEGKKPQSDRTEAQRERDDLVKFALDDRSQAGLQNVWVTWTIKNHSSEKSTYTWEWEAVGPDGTRLYNSTEFATDVQPGQTATGESPTTLRTADAKIHITEFNRTKSW